MVYSRLSTFRFATGPKRSMGHLLGAKNSFAVRRRTRLQGGCAGLILSKRSPWGRLGSVLYTCKRLRRRRRRFEHFWPISLNKSAHWTMNSLALASRASREHYAAASMAYAVQATTYHQTYLQRPPGADQPPKKVCNLGPMAPRSRCSRAATLNYLASANN